MKIHCWPSAMITAAIVAFAPMSAQAEQSRDFRDHVVHFNAIPTGVLSPGVASQFKIRRSKNLALLNISVLKKRRGTSGDPVSAKVVAYAVNLSGQARDISLREVRQGKVVYQMGEFKFRNGETLDFTLEVSPIRSKQTYTVKFRQQFFVD